MNKWTNSTQIRGLRAHWIGPRNCRKDGTWTQISLFKIPETTDSAIVLLSVLLSADRYSANLYVLGYPNIAWWEWSQASLPGCDRSQIETDTRKCNKPRQCGTACRTSNLPFVNVFYCLKIAGASCGIHSFWKCMVLLHTLSCDVAVCARYRLQRILQFKKVALSAAPSAASLYKASLMNFTAMASFYSANLKVVIYVDIANQPSQYCVVTSGIWTDQ
jgi:hypothetical protein